MSILSLSWSEYPPPELRNGAVTVGNFDGVHLGHAALVRTATQWATQVNGPTVAVTFDPPPVALLRPNPNILPLTTFEKRAAYLHEVGADHVIILRTDASLLALSAEAFFEDVLVRQLGAKAIVEGYNFRFGRARGGTTESLKAMCHQHGIAFDEVPPFLANQEPVSSSRVRSLLQVGNVSLAAALLGRNYSITGPVIEGAKRGRTIGFPTANLGHVRTMLPANGVYAVWATVDGIRHPAAANVGPNPTFGEHAQKIEVHLLEFQGDLYTRLLQVEFVERLRDTKPFANVQALTEQLQQDIAATRKLLIHVSSENVPSYSLPLEGGG